MISIGDPTFFESNIYKTYRDIGINPLPEAKICWRNRASNGEPFEHVTRIKLPEGITKDLASAAWNGDKNSLLKLRKILSKADTRVSDGYDGMYILHPSGNNLTLMGVGTRSKVPSDKFTITLDSSDPNKAAAQLDLALCKVSAPFDIGFGV